MDVNRVHLLCIDHHIVVAVINYSYNVVWCLYIVGVLYLHPLRGDGMAGMGWDQAYIYILGPLDTEKE